MSAGLWIVCAAVLCAAAAAVAVVLLRQGAPLRRLLGSGVQGLCALAAVILTDMLTGVSCGLGWASGAVCLVLGVPGVLMLLILKLLFAL